MKILAICGSLQAESSNLSLLRKVQQLAPGGVEVALYRELGELPHFNPDLAAAGIPDVVQRLRRCVADSDALLIASPEYGFSLPGSLKNAIDWLIDGGEIERKIVGVTASTVAKERGRRGLAALCDTLHAVSAHVVGGEPTVRGPDFDRDLAAFCAALVDKVREGVPRFDVE